MSLESTGIPISSEVRLIPAHAAGRESWYSLRTQGRVFFVDPPPRERGLEVGDILLTSKSHASLPEGMEQIPIPETSPQYHFLRAGGLLFVGTAAGTMEDPESWRALSLRVPREVLVLSSDLPPLTLGAFLDRLAGIA